MPIFESSVFYFDKGIPATLIEQYTNKIEQNGGIVATFLTKRVFFEDYFHLQYSLFFFVSPIIYSYR